MYVVSIGQGKVYRILPSVVTSDARNIQCGEHQEQPIANFTDKNVIDNKEKIIYEQSNQELQSIPANDNSDMEINVSIEPLKDPVARGESQAITITVTDSTIRPVANARISGVLLYPGDNFEREFGGITDIQGKFVYSWTIGNKGDIDTLAIEAEISSPGVAVSKAVSSFDIVE